MGLAVLPLCSQFYGVRSGFDLPRNEGNQQQDGGAADAISEGRKGRSKHGKVADCLLATGRVDTERPKRPEA